MRDKKRIEYTGSSTLPHFRLFMLLALLLVLLLSLLLGPWIKKLTHCPSKVSRYYYRTQISRHRTSARKPDWVRKEVIRLKAHLPDFGCRKLTDLFNSLHASRGMTVSKSFVYELLKQHRHEVLQLRRLLKNRIPSALPCNHTWDWI